MAAETAAPGFALRLLRAFRAEEMKARRQPVLLLYLALAVAATAVAGPLEHAAAKRSEAEVAAEPRATHTFGEPAAAPTPPRPAAGTGANGWLTFAAGIRAGVLLSAVLLLLFAAGLLAGEGTAGTCRLVLIRPVSRTDVVLAKALLLLLAVLLFTAAVTATGFAAGLATGGYGDYVDPRFGQVDYTAADLLAVAIPAVGLAPLALFAVAAFGLFVSSLFMSSATAVTAAVLGGLAAAGLNLALPPDLSALNFLSHVDRGLAVLVSYAEGLSEYRVDARFLRPGILVPAASALAFLLAARIMFVRRDIHA